MANRHKKHHKASGGKIEVDSGEPEVIKEAEEKKKGGKVLGKMHGKMPHHRLDRPGRKRGGRVGADTSPLSSAHKTAAADAAPHSNSER